MTSLRLTRDLLQRVHADLSRPHPFAHERVGFLTCRPAFAASLSLVLLVQDFHPVADADYERDETVGAMLSGAAFRRMLQIAYHNEVSVLHIHRHEHCGRPWFSDVDLHEAEKYVPDFWKVRPQFAHGIVVLSFDSAAGLVWIPATRASTHLSRISVIGTPILEIWET